MNTTRTTRLALASAVALAALAGAGCGSDDDAGDTADSTQSEAAAPAKAEADPAIAPDVLGSYSRTITRADIERTSKLRDAQNQEAGEHQEEPKPGPADLVIDKGGMTYTDRLGKIQQDINAAAGGELTVDGYIRPDVGSFCGPEVPQNASYTWKVDGDALVLEAKSDRCADRDSLLSGTWEREG